MKTKFLFPHACKKFGWIIFIVGIVLFFLGEYIFKTDSPNFLDATVLAFITDGKNSSLAFFQIVKSNLLNEIQYSFIIIGGILVAFSKERKEDEFIMQTRLDSLLWSLFINYAIILFCVLFIYGAVFIIVVLISTFSILFVFIARFHYVLYKNKRISHGEE